MQDQIENIKISSAAPIVESKTFPVGTQNYSDILNHFDLKYKNVDYYYQVGEIKKIQGWILHISVVIWQVEMLLQEVIPALIAEKVAFKIPIDKETARNILNGIVGVPQIGKIVSIYPATDMEAIQIATYLIERIEKFKGPRILTDIQLSNCLYTRYGSFTPVIKTDLTGRKEKYIYNTKGELIQDPYSIPFSLPEGVSWPFTAFATPVPPAEKKILNYFYKPTSLLKADLRGDVLKGIYVKGLFRTAPCVIKQGLKHMISEDSGRTIHDRLVWQQQIHNELNNIVPLPQIFDLFVENEDTYLVMEFIPGISLTEKIKALNKDNEAWFWMDVQKKKVLLSYLLQIIQHIGQLHENGYVHRDIQPANFLITKKGTVFLIDIELTWSKLHNTPELPFEFGTPGFMSPNQRNMKTPDYSDDIYGLGALMIMLFTSLTPIKFGNKSVNQLQEKLNVFIQDIGISTMIAACLEHDPTVRPQLSAVQYTIQQYYQKIVSLTKNEKKEGHFLIQNKRPLISTIEAAINGLVKHPIVMSEGFWYSKERTAGNIGSPDHKEYTRYPGLLQGIGGTAYVLARAQQLGINISPVINHYHAGIAYLDETYPKLIADGAAGLYDGAAGVALSIAQGVKEGLIHERNTYYNRINELLNVEPVGLDISAGVAGQGIALLQCAQLLAQEQTITKLARYRDVLITNQQKDGSWILWEDADNKCDIKPLSFGYGISGITWFLLEYAYQYKDVASLNAALHALQWLRKKGVTGEATSRLYIGDERLGVIMAFLKAFETLQDTTFLQIAEMELMKFPQYIVKNTFIQITGLAGLGELYLEALRITNNEQWHERARWIMQFFTNMAIFNSQQNACYWQIDEIEPQTADLLMGNGGIIHFLLRFYGEKKIGFCMLQ